jgi:hypothetical protein
MRHPRRPLRLPLPATRCRRTAGRRSVGYSRSARTAAPLDSRCCSRTRGRRTTGPGGSASRPRWSGRRCNSVHRNCHRPSGSRTPRWARSSRCRRQYRRCNRRRCSSPPEVILLVLGVPVVPPALADVDQHPGLGVRIVVADGDLVVPRLGPSLALPLAALLLLGVRPRGGERRTQYGRQQYLHKMPWCYYPHHSTGVGCTGGGTADAIEAGAAQTTERGRQLGAPLTLLLSGSSPT